MLRVKESRRGFALFEVLLGLAIFVIGVLALGRSVENCLNSSTLTAEDNRIRQVLSNRMSEIQTAPGMPDPSREIKVDTGYGVVRLIQKAVPAVMTEDDGTELPGIIDVTLRAEWERDGVKQGRNLEFYVYRNG
jgi:Tfp pilus assembly protein PilV